MQKTKAKRNPPGKHSRGLFAALWALMYLIGMAINYAFHTTNPVSYLTVNQANIASLVLSLIPTLLHVQMSERVFKQSMRGWLAFTMLGTFVTLLINPWAWPMTGSSDARFYLNVAAVIVPSLLLQTIWLWRRVKAAWIWPILRAARWLFWAAVTSLFPALFDSAFIWLPTVLEMLIEGAVIHTLLSHPKDTEKAKVDEATAEQSSVEHERIERLQEREHHNPLWNTGDEQALQSEA